MNTEAYHMKIETDMKEFGTHYLICVVTSDNAEACK